MRKSMLSIVTASMLLAGAGMALAQTTSVTTWTNEQGMMMREYSTTNKYISVTDPAMKPTVGMEVPGTITLYPLPDTMKVSQADRYRYTMVNNSPIVVDSVTRKVVYMWAPSTGGGEGGGGGK